VNRHQPLTGGTALVAGATRGAGRAFAIELAAAGAIVYATGRSSENARSEIDRPETIEGTAALAAEKGGKVVAVVCDHLEPPQVRDLISRIESERGRLDILVNNIWGGDHLTGWWLQVSSRMNWFGLRTRSTASTIPSRSTGPSTSVLNSQPSRRSCGAAGYL
jgi:NAD(P)-dependent dehydrogenase (short-subunit alcohol dehydrogenase family)